jgi:hypothetical protein
LKGLKMNITLEQVIKELKVHQQQDHYIQGTYDAEKNGEFRGCSIGCAVESLLRLEGKTFITGNAPEELERIGVPQSISRMIEFVFEKLPHAKAVQYSIDCHEAMIGKTKLDDVMRQQHIWMLSPGEFFDKEALESAAIATEETLQAAVLQAAIAARAARGVREALAEWTAGRAWTASFEVMDENFITAYADNLLKLIKEAD